MTRSTSLCPGAGVICTLRRRILLTKPKLPWTTVIAFRHTGLAEIQRVTVTFAVDDVPRFPDSFSVALHFTCGVVPAEHFVQLTFEERVCR